MASASAEWLDSEDSSGAPVVLVDGLTAVFSSMDAGGAEDACEDDGDGRGLAVKRPRRVRYRPPEELEAHRAAERARRQMGKSAHELLAAAVGLSPAASKMEVLEAAARALERERQTHAALAARLALAAPQSPVEDSWELDPGLAARADPSFAAAARMLWRSPDAALCVFRLVGEDMVLVSANPECSRRFGVRGELRDLVLAGRYSLSRCLVTEPLERIVGTVRQMVAHDRYTVVDLESDVVRSSYGYLCVDFKVSSCVVDGWPVMTMIFGRYSVLPPSHVPEMVARAKRMHDITYERTQGSAAAAAYSAAQSC